MVPPAAHSPLLPNARRHLVTHPTLSSPNAPAHRLPCALQVFFTEPQKPMPVANDIKLLSTREKPTTRLNLTSSCLESHRRLACVAPLWFSSRHRHLGLCQGHEVQVPLRHDVVQASTPRPSQHNREKKSRRSPGARATLPSPCSTDCNFPTHFRLPCRRAPRTTSLVAPASCSRAHGSSSHLNPSLFFPSLFF